MPSPPTHKIVMVEVVFPAIRLNYGEKLSLLPAMIINIPNRLCKLIDVFYDTSKKAMPSPQIEMTNTYLMA